MSATPAGGGVVVIPNPYVWSTPDDAGKILSISFAWNAQTRAITGISAHRDPGCEWGQVLVGLGAGNSPNTTDKAIAVPVGDTNLPQNRLTQLAQRGLATIDHVLSMQITADR